MLLPVMTVSRGTKITLSPAATSRIKVVVISKSSLKSTAPPSSSSGESSDSRTTSNSSRRSNWPEVSKPVKGLS